MVADLRLDAYGDLVIDADGGPELTKSMETLKQDIRHRVVTVKGSLPADANYGAGLPLFLHATSTRSELARLRNEIALELVKEKRILPQFTQVLPITVSRSKVAVLIRFTRKEDLVSEQLLVEVS